MATTLRTLLALALVGGSLVAFASVGSADVGSKVEITKPVKGGVCQLGSSC